MWKLNRILCLLLGMGVGSVNLPCEAAKQRFAVADDIGLSHFGDPYTLNVEPVTFSPDGKYFAVVTERGLRDRDRPESTLRVFRTEDIHKFLVHPTVTRRPVPVWILSKSTHKEGPIITHLHWSADSKGVAFLAKAATGNDQLLLAELKTRTVRALTPEGKNVTAYGIRSTDSYVYSAQSRAIREKAFAERRATRIVGTGRSLDSLIFSEDLYPAFSKWHDLSELWAVVGGKRFQVKDKSTGRLLSLYRDGQEALALSPDGRFVVAARAFDAIPPAWETLYPPPSWRSANRIRRGQQDLNSLDGTRYVSEYVLVELTSGKVRPLTNAPIGDAAGWSSAIKAAWSADGESVVLSNTFLPANVEGHGDQLNAPCVAEVDLRVDHVTCVERLQGSENGNHYILNLHFAPGSRDRVIVELFLPGLSGGSFRSTTYVRGDDGFWTVPVATSESTLEGRSIDISVKEGFDTPPVLVGTDKTTGSSHVIWDPNPQLKGIELGDASVFKWKDKTSRDWVGGLYKPPSYVQGRRYPLVIQTHGFVENQFRPSGVFPTAFAAQELAAEGFVVLQIRDCPIRATPDEGPCNVTGYEAAVQQLVADGLVDLNRIGIVGFSRTCYYVMEALTASTLHFKAASITDGVDEGYLQYITTVDDVGNLISHDADAVIGGPPFKEGLRQWLKQSPEFNMDKVETPLQVVALGRPSVLFMWEPYAALRYLNKPVDLVVLNSDEHILTNPRARMISQGGTVDWFRFWLNREEDPDPAKAEQYARWRELRKLQQENEAKAKAAAVN